MQRGDLVSDAILALNNIQQIVKPLAEKETLELESKRS